MDDGQTIKQRLCEVEGCKRPWYKRGYCSMHYFRWRKTGSPGAAESTLVRLTFADPDGIVAFLFAKRRITDGGCWVWTGQRTPKGYGQRRVDKRQYAIHRLAAWLWKGLDLRSDLQALHKCDNPPCFNPDHLFLGTSADNHKDKTLKNRAGFRLNEHKVRRIRLLSSMGLSYAKIAVLLRVAPRTIYCVVKRKSWAHLP